MILVTFEINFISIDIRSSKVENSSWRGLRHDVWIEALDYQLKSQKWLKNVSGFPYQITSASQDQLISVD